MQWFAGGVLNACYNCLDRHLPQRAAQIALIWEGDEPHHSRQLTYQELFTEVCRFANVLKAQNVQKGDRVCVYLPTIPEAVVTMLACARIGAIHSVVFGGFSAEALKNRINDAGCEVVVTADGAFRGGKLIPLKDHLDQALLSCPQVRRVIVVKQADHPVTCVRIGIWIITPLLRKPIHSVLRNQCWRLIRFLFFILQVQPDCPKASYTLLAVTYFIPP